MTQMMTVVMKRRLKLGKNELLKRLQSRQKSRLRKQKPLLSQEKSD